MCLRPDTQSLQAAKTIFTTPSSALNTNGRGHASGRAGNASLHGMVAMTEPAIAYVAMQVSSRCSCPSSISLNWAQLYFALSSAPVFNAFDPIWRPYAFYMSLLTLLCTPELKKDVEEIKDWLNKYVYTVFLNIYADCLPGRFSHGAQSPRSTRRMRRTKTGLSGRYRRSSNGGGSVRGYGLALLSRIGLS